MANTFTKIATVTVGSGGASSISFSSISSSYTDLCLKYSIRTSSNTLTNAYDYGHLEINGNTSSLSYRQLYDDAGTAYSNSGSSVFYVWVSSSGATASTFTNGELYFPNYTSSNYKSFSLDEVNENNGTQTLLIMTAGLWSNTSAINQLTIAPNSGTYVQYSTATLYGIKNS